LQSYKFKKYLIEDSAFNIMKNCIKLLLNLTDGVDNTYTGDQTM